MCTDTEKYDNRVNLKNVFSSVKAKLTLAMLGSVDEVNINEIPEKWENFLNTEDKWINVYFPNSENTTACIYIGQKGSLFKPHKHPANVEHFTILNKGGSVRVVTDKYIKEFHFPDSVYFEVNEPHSVEFLAETRILCMWHPKMKGWNAEFINE